MRVHTRAQEAQTGALKRTLKKALKEVFIKVFKKRSLNTGLYWTLGKVIQGGYMEKRGFGGRKHEEGGRKHEERWA